MPKKKEMLLTYYEYEWILNLDVDIFTDCISLSWYS